MIRFCISTASPARAKKIDGNWDVEGIGSKRVLAWIHLSEDLCRPANLTIHLTTKPGECIERFRDNMSDSSTVFKPIDSISPYFDVPQTLFAGKLQYVTGYNISQGEHDGKDDATVASNADLLDPEVYIWASFLLASFITFVIIRVTLLYFAVSGWMRMTLAQMIKKQLALVFYHSSVRFKWITLLYSLLCFYIVTSFLCLYKTSHIIMEKPFYAKNYQESLDYPSSLAFYFDQFTVISTRFKNAPPDSLRGKMWAKLAATGRQDDYSGAARNLGNLPAVLMKGSQEMTIRRGICIAAPLIIPLLRSLACGGSPEEELWIVKVIADPIEEEVIYGYAFNTHAMIPEYLFIRLKNLFESHSFSRTYNLALDQSATIANALATSPSHQWKQSVICDHEDAFAPQPRVKAITLHYFRSFFTACLFVWLVAFIINALQIIAMKRRSFIRSRTGRK